MIANLFNTLVGLWLTHTAIFPGVAGTYRIRFILIASLVMIGLALWARRSDASAWQSTTTIVTGVGLVVLTLTHQAIQVSDAVMFWGMLWIGFVSATVSLWAAIYRFLKPLLLRSDQFAHRSPKFAAEDW